MRTTKSSKFVFKPMVAVRAYLAGKRLDRPTHLVIRLALTQLLMLGWRRRYPTLPDLVISKELPLMELPFLNDREKVWMARANRFATAGQVDGFFRDCLSEPDLRNFSIQLGIKGWGALYRYGGSEKPTLPCDFLTLRVCTLLYRPRQEWSIEERAIMREGGIKIDPKQREQKFFRADW